MEYWSQILSVLGLLAVILLVLAGAWFFTRWAGQNFGGSGLLIRSGSRLRVLDRVMLGRDQALLVVKAGQRYLLLGSTPAGLTLLAELSQEEGENWDPPASPEGPEAKRPPDFRALMQRLREKK
ncbi:MAG: flagellar biosynthetic protein FliO [Lawsonibacter sp.]|uniref:flagellar biosynthetic protein FliO n=1 Tax=Lawsonibacter sp. JLR.KK007 TaxID=3114293 RepID=UPI00217394C8|nr:flagellar biosynthetic protein FliO [Lawsonibacter sp.]MCI8989238.1 flagellar biosynthetic protein FliO [Lawsonibacter sp.]